MSFKQLHQPPICTFCNDFNIYWILVIHMVYKIQYYIFESIRKCLKKHAVFWFLRFFIILKHPKEVSSRQFLTFPILWFSSIVMIIFFETMKTGKNHTSDIAFWKIGRKILIWTYQVFSQCTYEVSSCTIDYGRLDKKY